MLHLRTETVSFLSCLLTDESGFYCNTRRRYAYFKVKTVRDKVKKSKKLAGSSYINEKVSRDIPNSTLLNKHFLT